MWIIYHQCGHSIEASLFPVRAQKIEIERAHIEATAEGRGS